MNTQDFTNPKQINVLVTFTDITGFTRMMKEDTNTENFSLINQIFDIIGNHVKSSNGRIIKYIGDSVLLIHDYVHLNEGIKAIYNMKIEVDSFFEKKSMPNRLGIKSHVGEVIAGLLGHKDSQVFDILGDTVNYTALLGKDAPSNFNSKFMISVEAFRSLDKETRKLFHKYTPPIYYVGEVIR